MDALDRELSAALGVDPSPEFVARVRARVAVEPPPSRWMPRLVMTAAVAVAVLVVAVVVARPREQLSVPVPTVRLKADATEVTTNANTNVAAPQTDAVFARPHRVRVRRPPAVIQLVSIDELPDVPPGVVVPAMRFDEVVTMTGVHP